MARSIFDQPKHNQMKKINRTVGFFIWIILVSIAGFIYFLPFTGREKLQLTLLLIISIPHSLLLYFGIIPDLHRKPLVNYSALAFSTFLIGWAHLVLGPYNIHIEIFYPLIIVFVSIMGEWQPILAITLISVAVNSLVNSTLLDFRGTQYYIIQGFGAIGLGTIGIVSGFIGRTLQKSHSETRRNNMTLSMLVEANRILSTKADLENTLPRLAKNIAQGLPTSLCLILLLDDTRERLINYGSHAMRLEEALHDSIKDEYPLNELPAHQQAIDRNQTLLIHTDQDVEMMSKREREHLFFEAVKTVCIVPIQEDGNVIGLISIGEERNPDRESFPPRRMELLNALAKQIATAVLTTRLRTKLQNQANRLAVLYDVGKAISRTIEIDDLLELIHEQIKRVLPSDAYFVALYLPEEDVLDLRILIDNEKRYPPQKIPADQGLSSWIVTHHRPLLIGDLVNEIDRLPIEPIVVGEDKVTPSWLGVPLISEEELLGILAVASYQPYAFDESDQHLLEQIGQQAALSIKNARHHLEVEQRARLDSLTEVYNHGHFVQLLHQEAKDAHQNGQPLSLIMLDIDHFKQYNDTYGHVVGDQVLKLTVKAIQENIKKSDAVGRWGGEEFGIALPDANLEQAEMVANRIRRTLANLPLQDTGGDPIPKPTISQGIATLPTHTEDVDELIIIADRALYKAKDRGRDQVLIAERQQPVKE